MHRAGRAGAAGRPHDVRSPVRLSGRRATPIPPGSRLAAPRRLQNRFEVKLRSSVAGAACYRTGRFAAEPLCGSRWISARPRPPVPSTYAHLPGPAVCGCASGSRLAVLQRSLLRGPRAAQDGRERLGEASTLVFAHADAYEAISRRTHGKLREAARWRARVTRLQNEGSGRSGRIAGVSSALP
jgi:hypothetical protein